MRTNPVLEKMGRRLRLGVVGGAPGSFIGEIHRTAARMDGRWDIVCGVVSSDPAKALSAGRELGFADDRRYGTVQDMFDAELSRPDPIDAVAIMTPNDSHFRYASVAIDHGIDVICDKPITASLEDARALAEKAEASGLVFCLTHNYTGYPLVRQARAMIESGALGEIRLVQVEYVQGGRAVNIPAAPGSPRAWKNDPAKTGPCLVMVDIGTHAHNLLRFITRLEVAAVFAEAGHIVPGRTTDDFAGALLRLSNGARGCFWVTQAAAGIENSLKIRVSGSEGSLEWFQEIPQRLNVYPIDAPAQILTPNGPGILPPAARVSRIVKGHPEGFPEAFANLYSDAAEAVCARRTGTAADPLASWFPTAKDGLAGMEFVRAVIESSSSGTWVEV